MEKVGIPRALFYYQYFPLWRLSLKSWEQDQFREIPQKIMDEGSKTNVDEASSGKYYGHVIELKDKIDYLFIPRFTSVSKGNIFVRNSGGLPDMIRNTIPACL